MAPLEGTSVPQDGAGPRAHALSSFLAQQRWRCRLQRFLFTAIFQLPEIYCFFHRRLDFSSWILPAQSLLSQECCSWLTQRGKVPIKCCLGVGEGRPCIPKRWWDGIPCEEGSPDEHHDGSRCAVLVCCPIHSALSEVPSWTEPHQWRCYSP